MSATAIAVRPRESMSEAIESVVIQGDLSKLSPAERVSYYNAVCRSLGLNPLTRPFDYIQLNGKLTLYARKDCTDQLRKLHGISIEKPDITFQDEWIVVSVLARDANGRTDADTGVVNKKDMRGDYGNALMKAVTKAKRRVTLSICGLGMSDETEVETIPQARPVLVDTQTGEIVNAEKTETATPVTITKVEEKPYTKDGEKRIGYVVTLSDGRTAKTAEETLGKQAIVYMDAKTDLVPVLEKRGAAVVLVEFGAKEQGF